MKINFSVNFAITEFKLSGFFWAPLALFYSLDNWKKIGEITLNQGSPYTKFKKQVLVLTDL